MDMISNQELERLASPREGWCISIFVPTVEKSQQTRQNHIRFKNLLDQAEDYLRQAGLDNPEDIQRVIEPCNRLLDDTTFWQLQDKGLAVFVAPDFFQTYSLPYDVKDQVLINHSFYIKPLISIINTQDDRFYILAISQNEVRFFRTSMDNIEQIDLPSLPKSMAEALPDATTEDQIQWHTGTANPVGGESSDGERKAMYFGHGEGETNREQYLVNYFRIINEAVDGYLKDSKAPLLLAGVEYILPLYKQANTYRNLADEIIPGNHDGENPKKLHQEGWKRIEPLMKTTRANKADEYQRLNGQGDNRALKDVEEIVKAASYGRVEVLFLDKNAKKWGKFDRSSLDVKIEDEPRPENQDLLDFAAAQTLLNGGIVYVVEPQDVPQPGSPAAAILRY